MRETNKERGERLRECREPAVGWKVEERSERSIEVTGCCQSSETLEDR